MTTRTMRDILDDLVSAGYVPENDSDGGYDRLMDEAEKLLAQPDTKPIVLVSVEGGIADAHVVGTLGDLVILDWDNIEAAEELDTIDDSIAEIEALPDGLAPTIDKPGILKTLREYRKKLEAALA